MSEIEQTIKIGHEAAKFLNSDIGQYIREATSARIRAATERLITADPHKPEVIIALQNEIKAAEHGVALLIDLINQGEEALQLTPED